MAGLPTPPDDDQEPQYRSRTTHGKLWRCLDRIGSRETPTRSAPPHAARSSGTLAAMHRHVVSAGCCCLGAIAGTRKAGPVAQAEVAGVWQFPLSDQPVSREGGRQRGG